jgi:hypothetical protein
VICYIKQATSKSSTRQACITIWLDTFTVKLSITLASGSHSFLPLQAGLQRLLTEREFATKMFAALRHFSPSSSFSSVKLKFDPQLQKFTAALLSLSRGIEVEIAGQKNRKSSLFKKRREQFLWLP